MKSITVQFFRITVMSALLCALLTACAGSPAPASSADELDAAIREASTYLNGKVPKGSKAVFLNIKSDYPDLSEYILSVLSENAVNDGVFSVVDRQQLDLIRAELNFQMSGEVSDESAQSIGQMLGAQSIVSGAVSKVGSLYRIQVKAIAVQTAGVQGQWSRNVPTGATIAALTEKYAPAPVGTTAVSSTSGAGSRTPTPVQAVPAQAAAPAPAPAPTPAVPTAYKVGDKGPAGGIVFYDKGVFESGWQYLEAAPPEMEFKTQWGDQGNSVSGTGIGVGQGKQNTQAIATHMQRKGTSGTAAQTCQQFSHRGYTDWFMPSQAELNLMYINLKKNGLGGFSDDWYWSSSQNNGDASWAQSFADGTQDDSFYIGGKAKTHSVRAIRQF